MEIVVNIVNLSLDVDASEFYKMYSEYISLKDRNCKTCTVCGSRRSVELLKDAALFIETLEMSVFRRQDPYSWMKGEKKSNYKGLNIPHNTRIWME